MDKTGVRPLSRDGGATWHAFALRADAPEGEPGRAARPVAGGDHEVHVARGRYPFVLFVRRGAPAAVAYKCRDGGDYWAIERRVVLRRDGADRALAATYFPPEPRGPRARAGYPRPELRAGAGAGQVEDNVHKPTTVAVPYPMREPTAPRGECKWVLPPLGLIVFSTERPKQLFYVDESSELRYLGLWMCEGRTADDFAVVQTGGRAMEPGFVYEDGVSRVVYFEGKLLRMDMFTDVLDVGDSGAHRVSKESTLRPYKRPPPEGVWFMIDHTKNYDLVQTEEQPPQEYKSFLVATTEKNKVTFARRRIALWSFQAAAAVPGTRKGRAGIVNRTSAPVPDIRALRSPVPLSPNDAETLWIMGILNAFEDGVVVYLRYDHSPQPNVVPIEKSTMTALLDLAVDVRGAGAVPGTSSVDRFLSFTQSWDVRQAEEHREAFAFLERLLKADPNPKLVPVYHVAPRDTSGYVLESLPRTERRLVHATNSNVSVVHTEDSVESYAVNVISSNRPPAARDWVSWRLSLDASADELLLGTTQRALQRSRLDVHRGEFLFRTHPDTSAAEAMFIACQMIYFAPGTLPLVVRHQLSVAGRTLRFGPVQLAEALLGAGPAPSYRVPYSFEDLSPLRDYFIALNTDERTKAFLKKKHYDMSHPGLYRPDTQRRFAPPVVDNFASQTAVAVRSGARVYEVPRQKLLAENVPLKELLPGARVLKELPPPKRPRVGGAESKAPPKKKGTGSSESDSSLRRKDVAVYNASMRLLAKVRSRPSSDSSSSESSSDSSSGEAREEELRARRTAAHDSSSGEGYEARVEELRARLFAAHDRHGATLVELEML